MGAGLAASYPDIGVFSPPNRPARLHFQHSPYSLPCGTLAVCGSGFNFSEQEGAIREMSENLSEDRRKELFLALVDAQDHDMDVAASRKLVAERFGVSEEEVRQIEREGLDRDWPPL